MADEIRNILFLCTGNSARSILAEALLNRMGEGRFGAFSAGSYPRGQVHPMALALLGDKGFATTDLRSKSWDEFARPGAPRLDFIFTVCDDAAGEVCPVWPGRPMTAHWGIHDPADVEGPGQRKAFERAFDALEQRISQLTALPLDILDPASLEARVREIGGTRHG
jgi:arsenate reductase